MSKLKNKIVGEKEGWRLELDGKDLGDFVVAAISDMTKDGKLGSISSWEHLRNGDYAQQHSFLQPHQRFPRADAREVLQDPAEKYYTYVVAEVANKRYSNGLRGVGFDVMDKAKFSDGEGYVKMFYIPTVTQTDKEDFSRANVVKRNGEKE